MDFKLNMNGVFLLFVSNRCCALNFVPCEGHAFCSALNRFEQHQREELTIREALQPDLAEQPAVLAGFGLTAFESESDRRGEQAPRRDAKRQRLRRAERPPRL